MAAKKPYFDPVNPQENFPAMEKKLLDYWYQEGIVKKYLEKNKSSQKYFSFLDGPITANNPMGVHHAWGRTYKDLWQRYKNMQGYRERFQNGFDCQGLWVEVEVEKELGLKNKKDILALVPGDPEKSIARFVNLCKERALKFAKIQTEQSRRLGYFMDWDNSYFTMSEDNNYMIWHFLKTCHQKGLIYKGHDAVAWCPRCGTAISQHEMLTEDYKEVTHKSIYFELPIEGKDHEFLLVWTTTPWTIPANIAVAVDKNLDYALVEATTGDKFWLAKDLVEKVFIKDYKIIKTQKGESLVDLKYSAPFDDLSAVKKIAGEPGFHTVITTDDKILPVTTEEGTGLVHIATGAGTEDFQLGKKFNLPVLPVIEENADYLPGLDFLSGQNAKKHPEIILDYLEKKNFVFKIENYTHRYPACWRCKTELVWRVVDEWYIKMDPVRENMKNVAKKTRWIPSFGLKRELDWLKNMHDWLISKKRFWGLALPIWECSCGHFEVVGSHEELKEKAVEGWKDFDGNSPHRPWVDKIKLKCSKCGKLMTRIPDVGNPWLDAGIVPFSTISKDNKSTPLYLSDKQEWQKWFPADFITESFPGQFKNWFYSVLAMSTVLENSEAFKTCLGFATLLDEHGRPMHKSWGNAIEFNEGADKIGVDVMRFMYAKQNYADNLLFGYKIADETRRTFHLKLWNVYNFFVTYANLDSWAPSGKFSSKNILDKWIISYLNKTIQGVTATLQDYNAKESAESIESFVEDLSNWYVRRSRERVAIWAEDKEDKEAFYQTLYFVLVNLAKILAPINPFISDMIYQNLTKEDSIHLAGWPTAEGKVDEKLLNNMNNLRGIVEEAHSQRKLNQIPVRQPLGLLEAKIPFEIPQKNIEYLLLQELNVKKVIFKKSSELSVKLDLKLTNTLKEEAKARELIRQIQEERKRKEVDLTAKINVSAPWLPQDKNLLAEIKLKAGIKNIVKGDFQIS